jgi:hypothetical protein
LYFHGLKGRDHSSVVFADAYKKMQKYLTETDVLSRLVNSDYQGLCLRIRWNFCGYFRAFFETPKLLKASFGTL